MVDRSDMPAGAMVVAYIADIGFAKVLVFLLVFFLVEQLPALQVLLQMQLVPWMLVVHMAHTALDMLVVDMLQLEEVVDVV